MLVVHTECRLHFIESLDEVIHTKLLLKLLLAVHFLLQCTSYITTEQSERSSRATNCLDLSTCVVFGHCSELVKVNVFCKEIIFFHFLGVDCKDLFSPGLVRQAYFEVDFESARSKKGFINHIEAVSHADNQYVVKAVNTVNF